MRAGHREGTKNMRMRHVGRGRLIDQRRTTNRTDPGSLSYISLLSYSALLLHTYPLPSSLSSPFLHSDYYVLRPQRTPFPFSFPALLLFNSASLSHLFVSPSLHIPPLAQRICSLFLNDLHGRPLLSSPGLLPFPLSMRFVSISSSHRSLTSMPMSTFSTSYSSDASGKEPLARYVSSTRASMFP